MNQKIINRIVNNPFLNLNELISEGIDISEYKDIIYKHNLTDYYNDSIILENLGFSNDESDLILETRLNHNCDDDLFTEWWESTQIENCLEFQEND